MKATYHVTIWILVLASCTLVYADTPCAFEVKVQDSLDRPVSKAPLVLSLQNTGTEIYNLSTDATGTARICDAKYDLYQLTIGPALCGQVSLHNLYPILPSKRILKVIYDDCHSTAETGGCRVIARFRERGAPAASLDVITTAGGKTYQHQTDEYGRLFQYLQFGGEVKVATVDKRFRREQINFVCKPGLPSLLERDIDLTKR